MRHLDDNDTKRYNKPVNGLITLTTDFGLEDPYVGIMKGVMLTINPAVRFVDLSHGIRPQDINHGAYVVVTACRFFPAYTVHLVVVDPGVGSERRGIAVRTTHGCFVAPDNGVLSRMLVREEMLEAVELRNPAYWRTPPSTTFHGRDIFAPVAAHLSLGKPLSAFGPPVTNPVVLPLPGPRHQADGTIVGTVIHVDRYGNLITNIAGDDLWPREAIQVEIGGHVIHAVQQTFSSVRPGEPLAYIGSNDTLEIAVRNGNAATLLSGAVGDRVTVSYAIISPQEAHRSSTSPRS
ncbi:MAG: SAM-dependent chlorinase/fluorinase [Chloroflexi bacterium]|nr:SAM-dependent chlorinase/fluorinase [Chloroflexota bacterium]